MLPKKNRVGKKAIEEIFQKGRFVNGQDLTFKFILNKNESPAAISFLSPKSVAKLAVKRNRLRRRGYKALEKFIAKFHHKLPLGLVGVFIFKKYQDDILILENEIKSILNKIN